MRHLTLIAFSLVFALSGGCGDAASASGALESDASADVAAVLDVGADAAGPPVSGCELNPDADSDGDGLRDVVEDADRDCVVDSDETDPWLADTDGDGLPDGWEDVDRNGRWNGSRGEFDPRRADTDGDGIADGAEPLARVCSSELLSDASGRRVVVAEREVLLPSGGDARRGFNSAYMSSETGSSYFAFLPGISLPGLDAPDGFTLAAAAATGTGWIARFDAADSAAPVSELVGWFGAYGEDGLDVAADTVQVELAARDGGVALAAGSAWSDDDAADAWLARTRVGASAPVGARLYGGCEDLVPEPQPEVLSVVLVLNTSDDGLDGLAFSVEPVAVAVERRAAVGLTTRVVVVAADAHVDGAGGATPRATFERASDLRRYVAEFRVGDPDQRAWLNARAAIDALRMLDPAAEVALVLATPGEDTEFREGLNLGFDGHPFGDPLPQDDARDALVQFYADFLARQDVEVFAIRTGGCDGAILPDSSLVAVPLAVGGVYVDACTSAGRAALPAVALTRLGATSELRLSRVPADTNQTLIVAEAWAPPAFGSHNRSAGTSGARLDAAAAYLYWEAPEVEQGSR